MHNEPLLAELVDRSDIVYHLAAAVGVKLIVESPVNTIETNVHGTEVVLKLANKKKKKVLITSTSEVYGKSTAVPFREAQDLVLGPTTKGRWSYACSKRLTSSSDCLLAQKHLPVVIVACSTLLAPADWSLWHGDSQFCSTGHRPSHYGLWRRHQSRAFGYVGDVVSALAIWHTTLAQWAKFLTSEIRKRLRSMNCGVDER